MWAGCALLSNLGDYGTAITSGAGGGQGGHGGDEPSDGGGGATGGSGGLGTGGVAPSYRDLVLEDDPIAYWTMDDYATPGDDTVLALDATMNRRHLDLVGAAEMTTGLADGADPGALRVTDGGHAVTADDAFTFSGKVPFALEIWFEHQGGPGERLISRSNTVDMISAGYVLTINGASLLVFRRFGADGMPDAVAVPVVPNERYHALARYDGDCMCVFVIGPEGPPASACEPSNRTIVLESLQFFLGRPSDGFDGVLDEVAVFSGLSLPSADRLRERHAVATGTKPDDFAVIDCSP